MVFIYHRKFNRLKVKRKNKIVLNATHSKIILLILMFIMSLSAYPYSQVSINYQLHYVATIIDKSIFNHISQHD